MSRTLAFRVALAGAAALFIALPAAASTQIFATSYDMPNGGGQASGGSYNYWDKAYSGSGSTTTDGAALTGGLGDLTDGVVAANPWYLTENGAGTGPYVGWLDASSTSPQHNPTITFHFGGSPVLDAINIHLDNSQIGGVFAPASILVDGVSQSFTAPTIGTIGWVTLSGLNLTGGSHTVQFDQVPQSWTFVSEITFDGKGGGVPEPATWSMMIAGFGLTGTALRRRRAATA